MSGALSSNDSYVREGEFARFHDDVMKQFEEIKKMTRDQTEEFKVWMQEIREQVDPVHADWLARQEKRQAHKQDKDTVKQSIIDKVTTVGVSGAIAAFITWLGVHK